MRMQRLLIVLTGVNLALLLGLLAATASVAFGQSANPVVRASAIELVDDAGVVRAQLITTPEGGALLRMRDANGEVRVKLGADGEGSGLLLADGSAQPGLHVLAKRGGTMLSLTDSSGQQRVLRPTDP
jgi:hypothetical protein